MQAALGDEGSTSCELWNNGTSCWMGWPGGPVVWVLKFCRVGWIWGPAVMDGTDMGSCSDEAQVMLGGVDMGVLHFGAQIPQGGMDMGSCTVCAELLQGGVDMGLLYCGFSGSAGWDRYGVVQ